MKNRILLYDTLKKEGVSQRLRPLKALEPAYFLPEDRAPEDWFRYTAELSKLMCYADESNTAARTWEPFLDWKRAGLTWEEVVKYLNGNLSPDDLPTEKATWLSRPHFVLLAAFLRLLQIPKDQINNFTCRHLEFYYREVLRFAPRKFIPDKAHIVIRLEEGAGPFLLEKGTLFLAGKDSSGDDIHFRATRDTLLNQAAITELRSWFVEGEVLSMEDVLRKYRNSHEADFGFKPMLDLVYGLPEPGDSVWASDRSRMEDLYASLEQFETNLGKVRKPEDFDGDTVSDASEKIRSAERFFKLPPDDILCLLKVRAKLRDGQAPDHDELVQFYDLLRSAFVQNGMWRRVTKLTFIAESTRNIYRVMEYALGYPKPGDGLPSYGHTLEEIYNDLKTRPDQAIHDAYLKEKLFLDRKEFIKAITGSSDSWLTPLEKVMRMKTEGDERIEMRTWNKLRKNKDAAGSVAAGTGWRPFGNAQDDVAEIGIAIVSPLFRLKQGVREITLTLCFDTTAGMWSVISRSFDEKNNPFSFFFSTAKGYFTVPDSALSETTLRRQKPFKDEMWVFQTTITLQEDHPAIVAPAAGTFGAPVADPVLKLLLREPQSPLSQVPYKLYKAVRLTDVWIKLSKQTIIPAEAEASGGISRVEFDAVYHLHPFGVQPLSGTAPFFLPQFEENGALLLGIANFNPPDVLSLLFQMEDGSAHPESPKPEVLLHYLTDSGWTLLDDTSVVVDTTGNLSQSGILQLTIPADATRESTIVSPGKHWIKLSVMDYREGISDLLKVCAGSIEVVMDERALHYAKLPAETISEAVESFPAIKSIQQPYRSFGGRQAEEANTFYTRTSERLRHKQRALTVWDYERLVLQQFPGISRVRALPATEPGVVKLIVIPDLRNKTGMDPFEPRFSQAYRNNIARYLARYSSGHAQIQVLNPEYTKIKIRASVRPKQGFSELYCQQQLNAALQRFLSPWAFEEAGEINFGGTIYANSVVSFIDSQNCVDYVLGLKFFTSTGGGDDYEAVLVDEDNVNMVNPPRPECILVSAGAHDIDIVYNMLADVDNLSGIGYMKIELDFEVQ